MKKFFTAVLLTAVALIILYGVKYAVTPVKTQKIKHITQENSINTNGFIIRDEWIMTSRSAGTVYYAVREGDRVAKDSVIVTLFYGSVGDDRMKELSVLDNRIKNAQADQNTSSLSDLDAATVESTIYKRENEIIESAAKNDVLAISKYKRDINSLRLDNALSSDNALSGLTATRQQLLDSIGVTKEDMTAQMSGIFTTYTDGYEQLLSPDNIPSYDTSYFESLSQSPKTNRIGNKVDAGGPVCKIVNNHIWYVMMDIPTDVIEGYENGRSVTLRFNNMADTMIDGSIYHIGDDNNGRTIVTVKCSTYLENALSYRIADVDLIFDSYSGYRVPVHALHTDENGNHMVIGISSNKRYDCDCDVLFYNNEGGYIIVESKKDADNKLSQMERVVVGER